MGKEGESNVTGNKRFVLIPLVVCGLILYAVPSNGRAVYAAMAAMENFSFKIFALIAGVSYSYFYFKYYGKKSVVYFKTGGRMQKIIEVKMPSLKKPYMPFYFFPESRCLTIIRNFTPCLGRFQYRKEIMMGPDGGQFLLKWCDNDESTRFPDSATRPTILILPGVTSTSRSNYIRSIVYRLILGGYRVAVIVYRGLEETKVLTPRTYSATCSSDVELAVETIRQQFPDAKLFAVGTSLGSLILGSHLRSMGERCGVDAAMFFCCPFNAPVCAEEVETWANHYLINSRVAAEQKKVYRRNSQVFESLVDHEKILNAKHIREFDHHFTAPIFGYDSAEEYYEDCILDQEKLNAIKVPLLCVGSNDDPFSPEHGLPKEEICNTDNVALVMTYGGGHVSHLQGINPFGMTYFEQVMLEYFDGMLKV